MLSEKTLELNYTFELLTVADQFWSLIFFATSTPRIAHARHRMWPYRQPLHLRPAYALGLTLRDENRQGWDVRIQLPNIGGMPPYALFLQFKAGHHKNYSTRRGSAFFGNRRGPRRPFCEFGINNNSSRDQHILLQALAAQPNLRGSVSYVLPRIPNAQTFKACVGRLIHVSSVYSVGEVDAAATAAGTTIQIGHAHVIRNSYGNPPDMEILSEPKEFRPPESLEGSLLGEIVAVRVFRALTEWQLLLREHWHPTDFNQVNWPQLLQTFEVEIGRYLAVPPQIFTEIGSYLSDEEITALNMSQAGFQRFRDDIAKAIGIEDVDESFLSEKARLIVMKSVHQHLSLYRKILAEREWLEADIPAPETRHLTRSADGLTARLSRVGEQIGEAAFRKTLSKVSFGAI